MRRRTTYTLATAGRAPAAVIAALDAAGKAAEFTVKYVSRDGADAVRQAVRDGDATAGLAVLRPSQVLVGTVVAIGTVTLVQLLVLATPRRRGTRDRQHRATPGRGRRHRARGGVVCARVHALRVLVHGRRLPRQQDHRGRLGDPAGHDDPRRRLHARDHGRHDGPGRRVERRGVGVPTHRTAGDADPLGRRRGLPLPAPARHASTAATAVLLVWVASSIYRRALLIIGRRVRLREVIGGRTVS
jgi:hypothetical protein